MNLVIIDGKISSSLDVNLDKEMRTCKFVIKNLHYNVGKSNYETTLVRCICYGRLAEYCANELWEGLKVLITGRVVHRRYQVPSGVVDYMYVNCNTVTKVEQEEYE